MTQPRLTILLAICTSVLFALALIQVYWSALRVDGFYDLPAYTGSARAVLSGRSPTAQEYANKIHTVNFVYPPVAALLFVPLLIIPEQVLPAVFTSLSLLAFVSALWLTFLLSPGSESVPTWNKLLLIALLVQTFPLKLTVMLGQVNTIVLFFMVLGLYLFKKKHPIWSAVALSGAITLKLWPLVFLLLGALAKQWRWVLSCLVVLIVSSSILMAESSKYFFQTLPTMLTGEPAYLDAFNQSLSALFHRVGLTQVASVLSLMVGLVLMALLYRKTRHLPLWYQSIALLPILVLLPANGWQHHLVLMYPFLILFCRKWYVFGPIWFALAIRPSFMQLVWPNPSFAWSYQTLVVLLLVVWFLLKHKLPALVDDAS